MRYLVGLVAAYLCSCCLLSACGTLYSVGPLAIVESPEVIHSESRHTEFFIRNQPAAEFLLADDASARPLNVTNPPVLRKTTIVDVGAQITAVNDWQFALSGDILGLIDGSIDLIGMVKKQFIGSTYEKAQDHSHSLAAYSHAAAFVLDKSGDQKGNFGSGGYRWNAESHFYGADLGASYGYRPRQNILLFTGAAAQVFQTGAHVHQFEGDRNDSPGATYDIHDRGGTSYTIAGALEIGVRNRFAVVTSYSHVEWNKLRDDVSYIGLSLGVLDYAKPHSAILPTE